MPLVHLLSPVNRRPRYTLSHVYMCMEKERKLMDLTDLIPQERDREREGERS